MICIICFYEVPSYVWRCKNETYLKIEKYLSENILKFGFDPIFSEIAIFYLTHPYPVSFLRIKSSKEKTKKERKFDLHTITPFINTTFVVKVYMKEQERNTNQNTYINYYRSRKKYLHTCLSLYLWDRVCCQIRKSFHGYLVTTLTCRRGNFIDFILHK